jgi:hypothetical protein
LTSIALFDYKDIIKMKKPVNYYSAENILQAKTNPAVIHATTCFYVGKRMWVANSDHPFANKYSEYRNNTPWKEIPPIKDTRKISKRVYSRFWHCIPRKMAISLASFAINHLRPKYAWATNKASITTIAEQSSV